MQTCVSEAICIPPYSIFYAAHFYLFGDSGIVYITYFIIAYTTFVINVYKKFMSKIDEMFEILRKKMRKPQK